MNRFIYLTIYLSLLIACTEAPELNVPVPEPKICMSGFLSTDTAVVFLYKNEYILSDHDFNNKEDITLLKPSDIKIYENGLLFASLTPYKNEYYTYYSISKKPTEGNIYSIDVSVDGYPDVSANTTIPKTVPIISVDTIHYLRDGYPYVLCTINFQDPENIDNYYYFEAQAKSYGDLYYGSSSILTDDPIVEEKIEFGAGQILFTDRNINGHKYGLKVSVSVNDFHWSDLNFVLNSVSEEFYLHFKSYVHYDIAKKDEFSEPVLIYSNIDNGLGIFAGYSSSVYSFYGDSISNN